MAAATLVAPDATSLERPPELGQLALPIHSDSTDPAIGGAFDVDTASRAATVQGALLSLLRESVHIEVHSIAGRATRYALDHGHDPMDIAYKWVSAEGYDLSEPEVHDPLWDGVQAALDHEAQRHDPDSELNKFRRTNARIHAELSAMVSQIPVRVRSSAPRRLDRRLSGGTPRARVTRSSNTRDEGGDDPPPGEPPSRRLGSRREIEKYLAGRRVALAKLTASDRRAA